MTEVTKWVAMDKFLRSLPPEELKALGKQAPRTSKEMVEVLECALAILEISRGECREFFPDLHHNMPPQHQGPGSSRERRTLKCRPDYATLLDEPMPTEPD